MAGTVIRYPDEYFARKRAIIFKFTSDGSGDAVGGDYEEVQGGTLYAISFVPGANVTAAWDVTLPATYYTKTNVPISWADLLSGEGVDLSESTNGDIVILAKPFPILPKTRILPTVAGLGDTKTVYIIFHIWEEIGV